MIFIKCFINKFKKTKKIAYSITSQKKKQKKLSFLKKNLKQF